MAIFSIHQFMNCEMAAVFKIMLNLDWNSTGFEPSSSGIC